MKLRNTDSKMVNIIAIIFFTLIFLGILGYFYYQNNKDSARYNKHLEKMNDHIAYYEGLVKENKAYTDQYKIETISFEEGNKKVEMLIRIYNERDIAVSVECFVTFVDKNDNVVEVPNITSIPYIAPNSYGYGIVNTKPYSKNTTGTSYKDYKVGNIKVYLMPANDNVNYCYDDIEYEYNKEEGIIKIVNNSDYTLEKVSFGLLTFDGRGKINSYDSRVSYDDLHPGKDMELQVDFRVKYDKVVLQSAVCRKTS